MNTTYILTKEELFEKLKQPLKWFDVKITENRRQEEPSVVWCAEISFRGCLLGFLNCAHCTRILDMWRVMRWDQRNSTLSSLATLDIDEALEYIMKNQL